MLTWERPVSVSFTQARSYPASTAWKKVRDLCRRTEIANKTSHGCVAQFSRSFVDDRRKDGQRSEASGIVKPDTLVSGAWMFADSQLRVVRISSRTCPERVLRARYLALIIGAHSKFGRSAGEIRANLSRQNSRGRLLAWHRQTFCLVCLYYFFFFSYVSYPWVIFFWAIRWRRITRLKSHQLVLLLKLNRRSVRVQFQTYAENTDN